MTDGTPSFQSQNTRIFYGWDSLNCLRSLKGHRAAIVTDPTMEQLGLVDRVCAWLEEARIESRVVGRIEREPHTDDIPPLVSALTAYRPDQIVALGGGSALDAAKAAWAFYEYPALDWETAFTTERLPKIERRSDLIAIPTTSGTGSEVSRVAVLIDEATQLKRLIKSTQIMPTLAIVDAALASSMPPTVTAHSAMDALTHAVEAMVATVANPFSTAYARRTIKLIFQYLPAAYHQGERKARESLHLAATLAGLALNTSAAGIAHGMDQVGPLFGVPHGLVCAILLPHTLAFNLESALAQYAEMGAAIGVVGVKLHEAPRGFLRRLVQLEHEVGLPRSFGEAGVERQAYVANMGKMVSAALASLATQSSPRVPTSEECEAIFERAYWGNLPDWLED
jgi:alcohol dehydrogenase